MAFKPIHWVCNGDVITAETMNGIINVVNDANEAIARTPEPSSLPKLAALAAAASASQATFTRRTLLGLWKRG